MSLVKRLGTQFKAEFAGQILATVAAALLTILLARLLDPDAYGLLFLAISIFGVLGLFSQMGIAQSGARYISEYKEKDPTQIPYILRISIVYNLITISTSAIVLLLTYDYIATLIGEPSLVPFLLYGVFYLLFNALNFFVRNILQGFEMIKLSATFYALNQVSRFVFAIGFVLLGFGAFGAFIGYILSLALVSSIGLYIIYTRFYNRENSTESPDIDLRRRIGEYALPLSVTNTAHALDQQFDTILIGVFIGPVAVSFYTVSKQLVGFIEVPMSALGFTLSPMYGAQKAEGNIEQASRIYETTLEHTLLFYIPAAVGLILVAEPTIQLVFGRDYLGAIPVLQVLALYGVLQAVALNTNGALDYLGRARSRAIARGITAVLNVILNIILIPLIGIIGAPVATVITHGIYTFISVYIIHIEFGLRIRYLVRRIIHFIAITIVMALAVLSTIDFIEGWISFVAVIALGTIIWGVLAVATGILDLYKIKSIIM